MALTTQSVTLGAGGEIELQASGNFFRIHDATGAVFAQFDGSGREVEMEAAEAVIFHAGPNSADRYGRVRVRSATAQTIVIMYGWGDYRDDSQQVSVTTSATVAPGNTLNNGGDVSVLAASGATLAAADATRLTAIIKADVANTAAVRIGTTGVGAASGVPLEPGETMSISTTALIAAYNASGAPQNIHVAIVREV